MNLDALKALEDADLIILLFDSSTLPQEEDLIFGEAFQEMKDKPPVFLVLNKIDKLSPQELKDRTAQYQALMPGAPRGGLHEMAEVLTGGARVSYRQDHKRRHGYGVAR